MRRLVVALVVLAACEPFQRTVLTITPARTDGADSVLARTVSIADDVARRYDLKHLPGATFCEAAYYRGSYDLDPRPDWYHNVDLSLCVRRTDSLHLRVEVREEITARWGARGDSLRHELADTLRARLGRDRVRGG